mmetsp:Transcript_4940/g.6040  ORF Transcript_4940/g.6040 Transcript_4940/m.6040 type:complete len:337 (-) Transcript_4940:80-1090(-)
MERIGLGFGTAGLGSSVFHSVSLALEAGFRKFDTAEEQDHWYDQGKVGEALEHFFLPELSQECIVGREDVTCPSFCGAKGVEVSTKIPPWELTSIDNIRRRASESREILVGFCDDYEAQDVTDVGGGGSGKYPLDVYYIHAPECWDGWHPRCNGVKNTLPLRQAWLGMEAVIHDQNAKRIGLSNIWPQQLLDIIHFVQEREEEIKRNGGSDSDTPLPRIPDVIQIYADPLKPADELQKICERHGIEFVSYSTLGTQHRMRGNGNPVLGNKHIQNIAKRHNRSTAEVVLSWAMHHKNMSVIPRSSQEKHIKELANLLNHDPFLDRNDLELIDSLSMN